MQESNANHENDQITTTKTYGESRKNFENSIVVVTGIGRPSDATVEFFVISL
jgi:hypothetical protein